MRNGLPCVRFALIAAAICASAAVVRADIDASGRWVMLDERSETFAVEHWTQVGTTVFTGQGFTGVISPTTGVVVASRQSIGNLGVPIFCGDGLDHRNATVSADGRSVTGSDQIRTSSSPLGCEYGYIYPFQGSRCPTGTIEPIEQCDDGNDADGDGCSGHCRVERCWTCTGEPSSCAPVAEPCNPICPNGVLDPGEECDDGDETGGDGCDASCALEPCWRWNLGFASRLLNGTPCDGVAGACTANGRCFNGQCLPTPTHLPAGAVCEAEDGNPCTADARCDGAGHCAETPDDSLCDDGDACASETCDAVIGCVSTPKTCDDGDPCTTDSCSGDCVFIPAVRSDCRLALAPTLRLRSRATGNAMIWRWTRGAATDLAELADPRSDATYGLCVFGGVDQETLAAATLPPSATRWRASRRGFSYRSTSHTPAVERLQVLAGAAGRAKIVLRAEGAMLAALTPQVDLPLTVQLTNHRSNVCWRADYDAEAVRRTDRALDGRASAP
jgi:cysteine-rich repeat protein